MSKKIIIIFTVIAGLLIGGIVYFLAVRTPSKAETAIFRASLGTAPIPEGKTPSLKLYDPLLEAWFEGWDRLYYEFVYPEKEFSISTSNDNRKVNIQEIKTGRIHTITISYEGGRGFSPDDYWNEVLKKECPTCQKINNPVAIKETQGLTTFTNEEKEWIIFQGPKPSGTVWLFVAEFLKPSTSVEQILSTFTFIQPQLEAYKEVYPPPQPFIVRAYMSQYDNPEKISVAWGFQGMQENRTAYTVRAYWSLTPDGPWTKLADIKSFPATVYFSPPSIQKEKVYYRIVTVASKDGRESEPSQAIEGKATCCWEVEPTQQTESKVKIFVIGPGRNGPIGCGDDVVAIEHIIPLTTTPLRAALELLLSLKETNLGESGLYNALAIQNWKLESVSITNGEAIIMLSGKYVGVGTCEDPRIKAQLERTALQFSTVQKVSIFLNGTPLNELMSGKGE